MEVTALKYSGGVGLHGRSPLLRLQSDDRLVALIRRGNDAAFEILVSRYHSRLLAFCRHMLGSREDAEDVLQDVMASAYNAMLSDDRPINVRPWLYRIARNRSLNHMRRIQAVGVDSMDILFHDHGSTTADKAHQREEFRLLVGDIQRLPETQRTALVLREMDALTYEQIAEAMETTVPSVKSLLVRARIGLAEAAEARLLSCDEVRIELGEVAEGLQRKPSALVRRHLKTCTRCESFHGHLRQTNKALTVMLPIGPLVLLRKLAIAHLGHSAGSGAGAGAAGVGAGAGATGAGTAAIGAGALGVSATGSGAGGLVSAGVGALATKAAAGIAAAALVTAGAVEVDHAVQRPVTPAATLPAVSAAAPHPTAPAPVASTTKPRARDIGRKSAARPAPRNLTADARTPAAPAAPTTTTSSAPPATASPPTSTTPSGTTTTTTVVTVLPPSEASTPSGSTSGSGAGGASDTGSSTDTTTTPTSTTPTSTTPTSTTTAPAPATTTTTTTPTSTTTGGQPGTGDPSGPAPGS